MSDHEPMLVMSERDLPDGLIFEGIEPESVSKPAFSVSQAAQFFFARTSYWMRWRESNGGFIFDGEPVLPSRSGNGSGSRVYYLPHIEKMAHGLAQEGYIDSEELANIIHVVYAEAMLWGWLDEEGKVMTDGEVQEHA